MHVASIVLVIIIASVSLVSGVLAEPQNPEANFTLAKDATPEDGVSVGEEVTITLIFRNLWVQDAELTVTDRNPNPALFAIVQDSITGGATYVPAVEQVPESVQWDGTVRMNRSQTVTFRMRVLGGAGQQATNTASLTLKGSAGTLPDAPVAEAEIFIKPAAPVLDEIDNGDGDGSYLVAWSEVTGAVAYVLEEDDNSAFDSPQFVYSGSDSEVLLQDRAPGTWYYRVFAIGTGTVSEPSNTVTATVVMGVPQLYDILNPDNEPDYAVQWSEVAGATAYTLEEDDNAGFDSPATRYVGPNTEDQVQDQPAGIWYYRVRANGPGGISSNWSLVKSTRVGGPELRLALLPVMVRTWPPTPETPSLLPIENPGGVGDYTVNWSAAARAKTYILEEATDNGFLSANEIYVGTDTSFEVVGRGASRLFYRVKARNPSDESGWSNVQKVDVLWEAEPNDVDVQANGPIVSGLTYFGTFPQGAQDVSDYFYFDLPAGRTVELWLTNIPAGQNYDLVLRDTDLNLRGYSGQTGNSNEYISVAVPAGRYLIQAFHRDGSGSSQPYHLRAVYE
jgi:hypothetical protein